LWERVPNDYQQCHTYSDFWEAYEKTLGTGKHSSVGKETGQTAHIERWNNTLRQRISRYVRRTLSFSKTDYMHYGVTKLFIINYNNEMSTRI
ncbi:MAG: IS1 family transposase, partial [Ignavibacteriales bacterium]|nr:IS1 family transposase [Ignavibacteriales bacterium]